MLSLFRVRIDCIECLGQQDDYSPVNSPCKTSLPCRPADGPKGHPWPKEESETHKTSNSCRMQQGSEISKSTAESLLVLAELMWTWTDRPLGRCCKLPDGGGACFECGLFPWCAVLRCMLKVQSDPKHIRSQVEILQNTWKICWELLRYIPDYPFCNVQNL